MPHNTIGIIGLGTMGLQLILNLRDHSIPFQGYDPSKESRKLFKQQTQCDAHTSIEQLIESLPIPRIILLLIPDQSFTESLLRQILKQLDPQDIIIDAGNSHYRRTERFQLISREEGRKFIGMGISGGSEGARHGAAIMLGGDPATIDKILPLLSHIAALSEDNERCITSVGPESAGHFVKMVHNGIEYAEMQTLAELWLYLHHLCGMSPKSTAQQFRQWQQLFPSFLLECAIKVLEAETEQSLPLIHQIADQSNEKGTGRWTVNAALEYGTPIPSIAEAVFARHISQQSRHPHPFPPQPASNTDHLIKLAHSTLIGTRISIYAQGFSLIQHASQQEGWNINLSNLARGWRAGCIIRGQLINDIATELKSLDTQSNLLSIPSLNLQISSAETNWHELLLYAIKQRIPTPVVGSALHYYHAWQSTHLGADLIQGMRDNFGSHGFVKKGESGTHHHPWQHND